MVNHASLCGRRLYLADEWLWHNRSAGLAHSLGMTCTSQLQCIAHCLTPMLEYFWKSTRHLGTRGLTVFPGHLFGNDASALLHGMNRALILERRNPTRVYESLRQAWSTGVWHSAEEMRARTHALGQIAGEPYFDARQRLSWEQASNGTASRPGSPCTRRGLPASASFDFMYPCHRREYMNDTCDELQFFLRVTPAAFAAALRVWYAHVRAVLASRGVPFLTIYSEDLWADPRGSMRRTIDFLAGAEVSERAGVNAPLQTCPPTARAAKSRRNTSRIWATT